MTLIYTENEMTTIAYGSDLHLEFGGRDFDLPKADILLLAGDILVASGINDSYSGTMNGYDERQFIRSVSKAYKRVIWIPGNHEFWGSTINNTEKIVNDFLSSENIINIQFGSLGTLETEEFKIVFATLWTDIKGGNPLFAQMINNTMKDYQKVMIEDSEIKSGIRYLTPTDTMKIHDLHRAFIADYVNGDKKTVVMTHHAPNLLSDLDNVGASNYGYCCTDMDDIILDNENIEYWIHGHTHNSIEYNIGKTKVISNQRGYKGYEESANRFKIKTFVL